MAIDLFSENSSMSPRLSFSHDLSLSDILPIETQPFRSNPTILNSSFDFDFVPADHEPSSADEIFSDGKILPIEIQKKPKAAPKDHHHAHVDESRKQGKFSRQSSETEEKQSIGSGSGSRSFWRFKRSTSLNCGSGHGRSLGFCPLPLLSRSNSTGSAPNVKNPTFSKENNDSNHFNPKKQSLKNNSNHISTPLKPPSQSSSSSSGGSYQKPPLRKGNNGMKVNPVLNVNSGNLFGLGSVFFSGKDKGTKRK